METASKRDRRGIREAGWDLVDNKVTRWNHAGITILTIM
jgi:hypothetical protein